MRLVSFLATLGAACHGLLVWSGLWWLDWDVTLSLQDDDDGDVDVPAYMYVYAGSR